MRKRTQKKNHINVSHITMAGRIISSTLNTEETSHKITQYLCKKGYNYVKQIFTQYGEALQIRLQAKFKDSQGGLPFKLLTFYTHFVLFE